MKNNRLSSFSELERKKYLEIIPIISDRLNSIHNLNESNRYWEKILGFTLLLHVSRCIDIFYKYKNKECKSENLEQPIIINPPVDEFTYRNIYSVLDKGKENLVNIYLHSKKLILLGDLFEKDHLKISSETNFIEKIKSKSLISIFKQIIIFSINKIKNPTVLIYQVWWDYYLRQKIQFKSLFKVQFATLLFETSNNFNPDINKRGILSSTSDLSNDFDIFFFESLKYCLPSSVIEGFKKRKKIAEKLLYKKNIKHIINESVSEDALLLLAHAEKKGITTHYIEHNYLQHQFVGNNIWYIKRKFDYFLSLGWEDNRDLKHIPSSSNYSWIIKKSNKRDIKILYISALAQKNYPHFSSGYGESGDFNAQSYINMKRSFFNNLDSKIIKMMYYKDYPKTKKNNLSEHKLNIKFNNDLKKTPLLYDEKDLPNCEFLISQSKIIICDYLSTPYNSALLSNIPTIILFNSKTYLLKDDYKNFYDDLIKAKIMFDNPMKAAEFLNDNINNIDEWWNSKHVQEKRKKYINRNFGKVGKIDKYILSLIKY